MRLTHRRERRDVWAELQAEVERDCAALLADGWSRGDSIVLIADRVKDRLEAAVVRGIVAAAVEHEFGARR